MEVGAVKQAFNNEIILLKKNLNQAKIQIIHKLTRKAKTFTEKKLPEPHKEKLKRKAESAIKEVLIIKKIKARDIARFIVTHSGKLNDFLNKPTVNNDKACARLLLHKALQEKYKHIREKFSDISIKDLFMSRQERRKLKQEAREKQKNKKKGKDNKNKSDAVNVQGEWDVEMTDDKNVTPGDDNKMSDDKFESEIDQSDDSDDEPDDEIENDDHKIRNGSESESKQSGSESDGSEIDIKEKSLVSVTNDSDTENSSNDETNITNVSFKKIDESVKPIANDNSNRAVSKKNDSQTKIINKKLGKKDKNSNKNKNLKSKLEKRNFHKEIDETPNAVTKMVDPFFITSSGDNYMSLVEPRQPDEVKEVHKQGNRQYRRAVMFGHVPKVKPKRNFEPRNNNFKRNNNSEMDNTNSNNNKFNQNKRIGGKEDFNRKTDRGNNIPKVDTLPEKLHPSWEAKKKQSGILPFKGKKIVFDES
ncbi:serum response factor-binding protein 1 [Bicyclus anynana]|uniref:Serum response factor-binding protein 1 n=1 Tax=Bicyclus anynana TaxID=110368 RepID=A0A6J1NDI6_BICAN|nr:serum response factor-binding protein 1 [Bicyclus anynana]